ncbi:MAG: dimethyladenosine transferase [Candidatus Hydrogenedentota bacterium]|nr:MAG: dimethyladenosine transferase [Candidatus Hydrogenedentota bacterium]
MDNTEKALGILLFPGFELLDVFGPAEMFGNLPDQLSMHTVAAKAGPVASFQKTEVVAEFGIDSCPHLDWLLIPGGWGTREAIADDTLMNWLRIRGQKADLVMTVCTGTALAAKAGLLEGRRATSNKKSFQWVTEQGPNTKWIKEARWVDDGDRVTSSGVSAGIDMALAVIEREFGAETANKLAAYTEYNREHDPDNDPFAKLWN